MKWTRLVVTLITFVSLSHLTNSQQTFLDNQIFRPAFRSFRGFFLNLTRNSSPELAYQTNLKNGKIQRPVPRNVSFFCDPNGPGRRSATVPTSVHMLRPGDIDIIGAMGDSLTAGNGGMSTNLLQISVESKGVSFSIGGEKTWREYLTIPNILKEFNPKIYGYSTGDGLGVYKTSKFNAAELGAMSRDMPHMAKVLIRRMKSDPNVKPHHWKLVTFLIGSNDFCLDICYHKNPEEIVFAHEKDLLSVFRLLRDNLGRTMLNVVPPPSIKVLVDFKGKPSECDALHHFECPCFFGSRNEKNRERYYKVIQEWNKKVVEVANRDEFHDRKDFTINIQPFVSNVVFPTHRNGLTDFAFMSHDCFHLSQKGYALASNALWNNMMDPVGQKTDTWNELFKVFKCPTEQRPFLATRFN